MFRAPHLEKVIRTRTLSIVRASPSLVKEARQAKRKNRQFRNQRVALILFQFFFLIIAVTSIFLGNKDAPGPILAILSTFLLGLILLGTATLIEALYGYPFGIIYLFPISAGEFTKTCIRHAVLSSLWTYFYTIPVLLTLIPVASWGFSSFLTILLVSTLQWIVSFSLILVFTAFLPSLPYRFLWIWLMIGAGIIWMQKDQFPKSFLDHLSLLLPILPTGWPNILFQGAVFHGNFTGSLLIIPIAALVPGFWFSMRRVLTGMSSLDADLPMTEKESDAPEARDESRRSAEVIPGLADARRKEDWFSPEQAAAITKKIQTGGFLQDMDWARNDLFGRIIQRFLAANQMPLARFLLSHSPQWTRQWWYAVGALAIFGTLMAFMNPGSSITGTGIPLIILSVGLSLALGTPLLGGSWTGFVLCPSIGPAPAGYALFPIGFGEMTKLMLRINSIRLILGFPIVFALAQTIGWKLGLSFPQVWLWSLKALYLLWSLQPVWIAGQFSATTSDSSKFKGGCLLLLTGGVAVLVFIGAIAAFLVGATWLIVLAGTIALPAGTFGFLGFYGLLFNRTSFDLLPKPRL